MFAPLYLAAEAQSLTLTEKRVEELSTLIGGLYSRRTHMIELDYPPVAVAVTITLAFVAPFIYSLFVDNFDKSDKKK